MSKRTILNDMGGNVLPLAAAGILVLVGLVGGGVDMSRAYKAQTRLQSACDAAVLAGRRSITTNGFNTTAQNTATSYFNANFSNAKQDTHNTVFTPSTPDSGNTVQGTATSKLEPIMMQIFGKEAFNLSVNCSAQMGVGNSDVMMVLDTTGSMLEEANGTTPESGENNKLQDLQAAMKDFYDTVAAATASSNARIRYGFVPYSSSVNVGSLIMARDPNFIVDTYPIQSRQWFAWESTPEHTTGTGTSATYYDRNYVRITTTSYANETACNTAKPASTAWVNNGGLSTAHPVSTYINDAGQKVVRTTQNSQQQKQTQYDCIYRKSDSKWYVNSIGAYRDLVNYTYDISDPIYQTTNANGAVDGMMYHQVAYNVSGFKAGTAVNVLVGENHDGDPAWVSSTWDGCIEERQTVSESDFSFVAGTGITPTGALDLDIDTEPTASNNTKWAPMWPEVAFSRATGTPYSLTGSGVNSYCPAQAQLLTEMDESDFDDYADGLEARGSTYHDIGILWGARLSSPDGIWDTNVNEAPSNAGAVARHMIFMTDGELAPSTGIQSTYGIERNDWRVTDDGSSDQLARHRSRFLALCEATKAKGIRLWVIAFGTDLSADLETCSSDNSSFTATDSADLNSAFQEIASQVGELRVSL